MEKSTKNTRRGGQKKKGRGLLPGQRKAPKNGGARRWVPLVRLGGLVCRGRRGSKRRGANRGVGTSGDANHCWILGGKRERDYLVSEEGKNRGRRAHCGLDFN